MLAPNLVISLVFGSCMLVVGIIAIWQGTHCYRRRGKARDEEAGGRENLGADRIANENMIPLDTLGTPGTQSTPTRRDEEINESIPSKPDIQGTKTDTTERKEVNKSTMDVEFQTPGNVTYGPGNPRPSCDQNVTPL